MTAVVGTPELDAFQRAIAARFGLRFDDNRLGQLPEVLGRRIEARGMTAPAYLEELSGAQEAHGELSALLRSFNQRQQAKVLDRVWFRDWQWYCGNGGDGS